MCRLWLWYRYRILLCIQSGSICQLRWRWWRYRLCRLVMLYQDCSSNLLWFCISRYCQFCCSTHLPWVNSDNSGDKPYLRYQCLHKRQHNPWIWKGWSRSTDWSSHLYSSWTQCIDLSTADTWNSSRWLDYYFIGWKGFTWNSIGGGKQWYLKPWVRQSRPSVANWCSHSSWD